MTRRRRFLLAGTGLASLALLVVGAHGALVRAGGICPIKEPTATELEAQRQRAMRPLAASTDKMAPLRDTLLGGSLRRFIAEEESAGARCAIEPAGASVRCADQRGEVLARFDPADHLVALDRVQYGLSAEAGELALTRMLADARLRLGEPARQWGERSASYLGSPLRQAGYEYRFADVAIDVTATHLGRSGVVVREQHRAVSRADTGS